MKISVMKHTKIWYSISIVIIVVGLVLGFMGGFNAGIDFTGGTMIHIDMGQTVSVSDIKEFADKYELKDASIVHVGQDENEIMIKTKQSLSNSERTDIFNDIAKKYNLTEDNLLNSEQIGPSIGGETRRGAVIAIFIASIGMLIYIAFRFEWKFAVAAVIALIHDILIMLAFYGIFRIPINTPFIAAILIIVGYSINDTIVIFDRIRENIITTKKNKYEEMVDISINQTLRRSVNTSITTLLAIICLYIFGVTSIKDFTLPIIAGIIAGTYSSIFIASPLWYNLNMIFDKPKYFRK